MFSWFCGGKKDEGEDTEDDYGDSGKIRLRGNPRDLHFVLWRHGEVECPKMRFSMSPSDMACFAEIGLLFAWLILPPGSVTSADLDLLFAQVKKHPHRASYGLPVTRKEEDAYVVNPKVDIVRFVFGGRQLPLLRYIHDDGNLQRDTTITIARSVKRFGGSAPCCGANLRVGAPRCQCWKLPPSSFGEFEVPNPLVWTGRKDFFMFAIKQLKALGDLQVLEFEEQQLDTIITDAIDHPTLNFILSIKPKEGPYADIPLQFHVQFSPGYPMAPMGLRLLTPVCHPGVIPIGKRNSGLVLMKMFLLSQFQFFIQTFSDPFAYLIQEGRDMEEFAQRANKWTANRAKVEKKIAASAALRRNDGIFCPEAFLCLPRALRETVRAMLLVRRRMCPSFPVELLSAIFTFLL